MLDDDQIKTHQFASNVLNQTVDKVWDLISKKLQKNEPITDYEVQQFMIDQIKNKGCVCEGSPMCAAGKYSAIPHYYATKKSNKVIAKEDFIFLDLWCKQTIERAVYADITRVGVVSNEPDPEPLKVFNIVKKAGDSATDLVMTRMRSQKALLGREVDHAAREVIIQEGYGDYFIHKTGHNIGIELHGSEAQMDSFETKEIREVIPGTCFSIEPTIYLPGKFGVRLEYDILIASDYTTHIFSNIQDEIVCLL